MELRDGISLYGAITATVAIIFSSLGAYNALKDRAWPRIKVRVVPARHGRVVPGRRHVIVDVANVGRRRALLYPPVLECMHSGSRQIRSSEPDEYWQDGSAWVPVPETCDIPQLMTVGESQSETFLYYVTPDVAPLRVRLTNGLGRTTTKYLSFGRIRFHSSQVARLLTRLNAREPIEVPRHD